VLREGASKDSPTNMCEKITELILHSQREPNTMNTDKYEKIKVAQYKPDWLECPKCKVSFNLKDRSQWTGMIHKPCGQRLEIEGYNNDLKFIWCLKANVADEETNRFNKGTKVFLFPPFGVMIMNQSK
jgi:hypothetical protein